MRKATPVLTTLGVEGIFRQMPLRTGKSGADETAAVLGDAEAGGGEGKPVPDARSLMARQVEANERLATALSRTSYVLLAVTLIWLAFCIAVSIQLALFLTRVADSIEVLHASRTRTHL